jgi:hypothetical protein
MRSPVMETDDFRRLERVPAFICSHVFEKNVQCLVSRAEGDWQFLCGSHHSDAPKLVCLGHLLVADPSLQDVLDLEPDWDAERTAIGEPWLRHPSPPEE